MQPDHARTYGFYFMGVSSPFLQADAPPLPLERGLIAGGVVVVAGLVGGLVIVGDWIAKGAGSPARAKVALLLTTTVVVAGVQIFFASPSCCRSLALRRPR